MAISYVHDVHLIYDGVVSFVGRISLVYVVEILNVVWLVRLIFFIKLINRYKDELIFVLSTFNTLRLWRMHVNENVKIFIWFDFKNDLNSDFNHFLMI